MERINSIYGSGLSPKSILVYKYMKGFENNGGCFASYNYMSKQLNLSRSSLIRAIKELETFGYLYK
jgi:DNA-binding Lrp family transcriptional regulator